MSNAFKRYGAIKAVLFVAMLFGLLGLAELGFRLSGKYATFNENYGKPYHSLFAADHKSWYHIYEPHQVTSQTLKEYAYAIRANNEGLLDNDFVVAKKPNTLRIMVMGDSFVQGMGAGTDSTLPKQLESILKTHYQSKPEVEVWNCGIGNSDPVFEYKLFTDRLIKYHPDFVIEVVNFTDISDVILRGGLKRFNADSTVTYNQPPWFEPLYAHSYLIRRIIHDVLRYNWQFLRPEQEKTARRNSEQIIVSVLEDFKSVCAVNHIPFMVAFHPGKSEMTGQMDYSMPSLIHPCDSLQIQETDIRACMLSAGFDAKKSAALYWPIDGHCNRFGYQVFAECLSGPVIHYLDSAFVKPSKQD